MKSTDSLLWTLRARNGFSFITSLAFSPDGKALFSADSHGIIYEWLIEGTPEPFLQASYNANLENDVLRSLTIFPESTHFSLCDGDGFLHIYSSDHGLIYSRNIGQESFGPMTFSVDRKRLVSGSSDGSVRIWNSGYEGSGELSGLSDLRVLREHEDSIESLAFSPDGELFASLDRKGILKIWSSKGELKSTSRVSLGYKSILHFSDTELLFASVDNDNSIRIGSNQQDWGCCLRGYKFLLKGHRTLLRVMCFSPNKGTLASADQDGTIRIWDCNRDVRSTVVGCHKGVYQLRFSPDGKLLASAGAGGDINIWAVT